MVRITTEAIALRRTPFGETSQVVELFTRARGRLGAIAKGVHRAKPPKGGPVDLLDHGEVTLSARRGSRSMPQLVERRVLSHHPGLRRRSDLMMAGQSLVELLQAVTAEGQPVPLLFDLSVAYLAALDAGPAPSDLPATLFALQGGILRLTGFEPVLDRCVACDRRPDGHRLLRCDPLRGGIVCGACRTGADRSFTLSAATARILQGLGGQDPRRMADVSIPPDIQAQIRRFYDRVLLHVLERPPRCHPPALVA